MATITGMTAAAMIAIRDGTVVGATFDSANHLILTRYNSTQIDAGTVGASTTAASGLVELATSAETQTGTDTGRAVTPAGLASIPGNKVQNLADNAKLETALGSSYPMGISVMTLTTGSTWTINSGLGAVVTIRHLDDRTQQYFYSSAGGTQYPRTWIRTSHPSNGGGGWTGWSLFQTIFTLDPTSFTQTTAFTSYPSGMSRLYFTTSNASTWDFTGTAGEVTTFVDGTDFARQTFTQHGGGSGTKPNMWIRTANSTSGWTNWRKLVFEDRTNNDVKLPTAMASGTLTITPVANTPTSQAVTFPVGRFTAAPHVVVSLNTTVPGTQVTGWSSANVTSSGFDAYVTRTNTTNTVLYWTAVQYT